MRALSTGVGIGGTVPVLEHFVLFWREFQSFFYSGTQSQRDNALIPAGFDQPPGPLRARLIATLERQRTAVLQTAPPGSAELYREALYVMVALADEILLASGHAPKFWLENLLETHFFQTRSAGDELFLRIDRLLVSQQDDRKELAAVYLNALALGFAGRYRGRAGVEGELARYRSRLASFAFGVDPPFVSESTRLIPAAYRDTIHAGKGKLLSHPGLWWLASLAVVILWLAVSTGLWFSIAKPVQEIQQEIHALGTPK